MPDTVYTMKDLIHQKLITQDEVNSLSLENRLKLESLVALIINRSIKWLKVIQLKEGQIERLKRVEKLILAKCLDLSKALSVSSDIFNRLEIASQLILAKKIQCVDVSKLEDKMLNDLLEMEAWILSGHLTVSEVINSSKSLKKIKFIKELMVSTSDEIVTWASQLSPSEFENLVSLKEVASPEVFEGVLEGEYTIEQANSLCKHSAHDVDSDSKSVDSIFLEEYSDCSRSLSV